MGERCIASSKIKHSHNLPNSFGRHVTVQVSINQFFFSNWGLKVDHNYKTLNNRQDVTIR